MAQHDYIISNATFPAVRTDLNNALSAIQTTNSGTSRPTGAVAGQLWLDTTSATTPTLKYYDGADDISLATIDHVGNTVNWLDSTVSITGLSTTATGTVLTLSDSANTTTVNLIIDNQKEIRFRETTANGTNYVALKAPASVSADLTFTLPSTDGTSGQALVTNGSGVLSFANAGTSWQSVQTTGFTAVSGRGYPCNTTSSAFTVTLPSTPSAGDEVIILDYAGTFDTNALTISPNGGKIEGATANLALTGEREGVRLVYIDSTQGWLATSGINEGTDALEPLIYSVEMLVVAGGGAGGENSGSAGGGGGGAGGFRTSTQNLSAGSIYTVTVGAGGAKGTANSSTTTGQGGSGGDSSVSGSGITTITSTGGGGGGAGGANNTSGQAGKSGGSGGGTGAYGTNVGGAGNTPSTSPSQGNNGGHMQGQPYNGGGGGGGANAVGGNVTTNLDAGAGGNGTASSITGSSVTYAGGGGGGVTNPNPTKPIAGGNGGGGAGAIQSGASAVNGTANLGGGGGGSSYSSTATSGAGGSGVVILRMLATKYSGTTTGSPTVTDDGSYKVVKFTGSGSYTA
jgi:hypothetical protein